MNFTEDNIARLSAATKLNNQPDEPQPKKINTEKTEQTEQTERAMIGKFSLAF